MSRSHTTKDRPVSANLSGAMISRPMALQSTASLREHGFRRGNMQEGSSKPLYEAQTLDVDEHGKRISGHTRAHSLSAGTMAKRMAGSLTRSMRLHEIHASAGQPEDISYWEVVDEYDDKPSSSSATTLEDRSSKGKGQQLRHVGTLFNPAARPAHGLKRGERTRSTSSELGHGVPDVEASRSSAVWDASVDYNQAQWDLEGYDGSESDKWRSTLEDFGRMGARMSQLFSAPDYGREILCQIFPELRDPVSAQIKRKPLVPMKAFDLDLRATKEMPQILEQQHQWVQTLGGDLDVYALYDAEYDKMRSGYQMTESRSTRKAIEKVYNLVQELIRNHEDKLKADARLGAEKIERRRMLKGEILPGSRTAHRVP